MKRNIFLILFFFIGKQIYSQNNQYTFQPETFGFGPQGFPLSLINGYGNSGLLNDVSNIGSMNPAALENYDSKAIGISYQFGPQFKISEFTIRYERLSKIIPQSIGFVYPIGELKIGLSMHQKYNVDEIPDNTPLKLGT